MEIKHQQHGHKGSFYIEKETGRLAEMTYSRAGEKLLIIDHTEVGEALRGQGAGKQLVMAGVEYARANELKILPLCPYAKSVFQRVEAIQDVLK